MAKQSTITFRTLGVNGVAQALHLLKQQGRVERRSLRVVDDREIILTEHESLCLGDELNEWAKFASWRDTAATKEDRRESVVYGNCLSSMRALLGRRQVNEWMKRAAESVPKAADLADEMNGGDDAKKSCV